MNVSGVSSSHAVTVGNKSNSLVNELQKQKMELTQQIAQVRASKEEAKSKEEKIKNLNEQIVELDKQIMQAQIDEKQKELEESQQKNAERIQQEQQENADRTGQDGVVLSASLNQLLRAKQNHAEYKDMDSVRSRLTGEQRVVQAQIKHSRGGSTRYQMGVISESQSKLSDIAGQMAKRMKEVHKNIENAQAIGVAEAKSRTAGKTDEASENEQQVHNDEGESLSPVENIEVTNLGNRNLKRDDRSAGQEDTENQFLQEKAKGHAGIDITV